MIILGGDVWMIAGPIVIANKFEMTQAGGRSKNVDWECVATHFTKSDSMKTGGLEEMSKGVPRWR